MQAMLTMLPSPIGCNAGSTVFSDDGITKHATKIWSKAGAFYLATRYQGKMLPKMRKQALPCFKAAADQVFVCCTAPTVTNVGRWHYMMKDEALARQYLKSGQQWR